MRRFALALVVAASATSASAGPVDFLRGAIMDGAGAPSVDWGGYYVGMHAATGSGDFNFRQSMEFVPGGLPLGPLGKVSSSGSGFGGFIGYNAQWTQALLGFEINYTRAKFNGNDSDLTSGVLTAASMNISDIGSARLRAGWAPGMFMPYLFGGMSFGVADITRTITANGVQTALIDDNHYIYGYAVGAGVDIMLFGNGFLRAEWEYLKFTSPVDTSINTVRAGLGWRF